MNIVKRVFNAIVNKDTAAQLPGRPPAVDGSEVYTKGQYILQSPFGYNPPFNQFRALELVKSWAFICSNLNAGVIAGTPLKLYTTRATGEPMPKIAPYRKLNKYDGKALVNRVKSQSPAAVANSGGGDVIEITEHPVLDLVRNINPYRNHTETIKETMLWRQNCGNCYWYIVRGQHGMMQGIPTAIWILPSERVNVSEGAEPSLDPVLEARLRDYFAALAMQGLLASEKYCDFSCKDIAEIAYKQADEMLEEREYAQ
jgi:hypothetical protein